MQTRFASLPLSCEGFGLSWTRSGAPVPTGVWPSSVFARLFLEGRPDEVQAQAAGSATARASSTRWATRPEAAAGPGSADRDKLDEYFTSVRELEQRLAQSEEWAKKPKPKVDVKPPQNITNPTDLVGKTRLWFDLIHLALQTDSTRLVTLQLLGTSGVPPMPACAKDITTCRTTARTRLRLHTEEARINLNHRSQTLTPLLKPAVNLKYLTLNILGIHTYTKMALEQELD